MTVKRIYIKFIVLYSGVAQLAEQVTVNHFVGGSSPSSGGRIIYGYIHSNNWIIISTSWSDWLFVLRCDNRSYTIISRSSDFYFWYSCVKSFETKKVYTSGNCSCNYRACRERFFSGFTLNPAFM